MFQVTGTDHPWKEGGDDIRRGWKPHKIFKRLCRFNLQRKVLSIFQVTEPDPISVRSVQGGLVSS